ncbi:MAG: DnaD domain protein [Oscillospiraceae bacterium]|nr:DnaD domain protein [Oscillospiraceae bacterium]
MSIQLNLGKWGTIFPVPNCVVDEDIRLASENQLKVLLYILRNNGDNLTEKSVGEQLNIAEGDVKDAVSFWVDRGVLTSQGDIPQSERAEIPDETPVEIKKKPRPLSRVQKPDSIFVSRRINEDNDLATLVQETQVILGKPISNGDTATLVMLHDTDGLPCDVLMMLIQYCHSIGKDNMRYIEKMAIGWASEEITTVERAEEKISNLEKYGEAWNRVSAIFGIQNSGSPTKAQQENANRWINEWHFSDEMLREAYERCVNKKNNFNITYTNGILKNWNKRGISSLKELKDFEETSTKKLPENKGDNTPQVSYDIDKYEEFSMFD